MDRLIEITGPRGFTDMGITEHANVATAMEMRRRRRHRADQLQTIAETIESQSSQRVIGSKDVPLWR